MVVDNRKNGPEPIEVMRKISDRRCCPLVLEQNDEMENWMGAPSLEDEIANAIALGCASMHFRGIGYTSGASGESQPETTKLEGWVGGARGSGHCGMANAIPGSGRREETGDTTGRCGRQWKKGRE
jgi:hypothetical protein